MKNRHLAQALPQPPCSFVGSRAGPGQCPDAGLRLKVGFLPGLSLELARDVAESGAVPTRVKAAIAATAINAAMSAYSIAVTPDLSLTRFEKKCSREGSFRWFSRYTQKLQLEL
jgi:hypothetical protein